MHGHDLGKLLKRLEESDDDLFAAGGDRHLVVEFIRNQHSRGPKDDQGCYPTTTSGVPSLAAVCCANPPLFRRPVEKGGRAHTVRPAGLAVSALCHYADASQWEWAAVY
ncbi:hypothetical protein ACH4U7_22065 [Streptomyces sp. NPDC020845]|uniref:hypothetical protein n=1 Tax=Streptomyces sp. NPDC020845 TaxID=3365096 RepID=UPI0037BA3949